MSTSIKTVAITAAHGNVGGHITNYILKKGYAVRILNRAGATQDTKKKQKLEEFKGRGATIVDVDYDNIDSIVAGIKGVDVVVSAFGGNFLQASLNLVEAIHRSPVKLFLPTEYGCDVSNHPEYKSPMFQSKHEVFNAVKKYKIPYMLVICGYFIDMTFEPWFGFDFANGKVTTVGTGKEKWGFCHREDVGKYVAEAIGQPKFWNGTLGIHTDTLTADEIVANYEEVTGKKISKDYITPEKALELRDSSQLFSPTFLQMDLQLIAYKGISHYGVQQIKEFPNIKPITVRDFFVNTYGKK